MPTTEEPAAAGVTAATEVPAATRMTAAPAPAAPAAGISVHVDHPVWLPARRAAPYTAGVG
ncbi:MAG TPA: hypothetical protein VGG25_17205 [Streptosporangiaceae bacterium]